MSSILLLVLCLVLGALVARFVRPAPVLPQSLNWWVINVALPALVLHLIPQLELDAGLWFLAVSMWLVLLGGWLFFATLGRLLHWSRERIGALTLVCGLGNTSFVGFPLIEALRGQEGLRLAVVADQTGGFLALAVGGAIVAAVYSGGDVSPKALLSRVLWFPAFICLLIGAAAGASGGWPQIVDEAFARIGATLVPLALFSVGLQLRLRFDRSLLQPIALGLGWKLALAPAAIALIGVWVGASGEIYRVSVLEAAMAPMISASILAEQHRLEPMLANTVLGLGIVLSFFTVPLVHLLLR